MELTIAQALRQGVAAHKEGKLQDAERLYRAILKSQPTHADANHNLGVLAVSVNKADVALPLFKNALEVNSKIEQYWLSYIDALIKLGQLDDARQMLVQGQASGLKGDQANQFKRQLANTASVSTSLIIDTCDPSRQQIDGLIALYTQGKLQEAIVHGNVLARNFPDSPIIQNIQGVIYAGLGRYKESIARFNNALELKIDYADAHNNLGNVFNELKQYDKAISSYNKVLELKPNFAMAHYNLGVALRNTGKHEESITSYNRAIELKPDYDEAYNNLGAALTDFGKYDEAITSFNTAIELKPDHAEIYNNLGDALNKLGLNKRSIISYRKAIGLRPDFAEAYWNQHGLSRDILSAIGTLSKVLIANPSHAKALITIAGLKAIMGSASDFYALNDTKLVKHAFKRSFDWFLNLKDTPKVYFNRWHLFDDMIKLADKTRPFYEYGVWMGVSFEYLIKVFGKGIGFDTFSGLPEGWHDEKSGSYSSKGIIPEIEGGDFIVGKFEDTLPTFFSEKRPNASIINFDADLYSSTICALRNSKNIIDEKTILIFDEFIMNKYWEEDEYKAINDFCPEFGFIYQVLAVSFFTKQVALKIIK